MSPVPPDAFDALPAQPQVLLVDDDEVNLLLTGVALRERGFRPVEAASGEQALELLRQHAPDIVGLDAMMPGLDGYETCRRLKADPATAAVPVVFLTARTQRSESDRALELGAVACLPKPFDPMTIAAELRAAIGTRRG